MCELCVFPITDSETAMEAMWYEVDSSMEMEPVQNRASTTITALGYRKVRGKWTIENEGTEAAKDVYTQIWPGGWTKRNEYRDWEDDWRI